MAKYRVKAGHENEDVCTVAPLYRNGNGRFILSECTQKDLKYLYEVVHSPEVEIESASDEKEK